MKSKILIILIIAHLTFNAQAQEERETIAENQDNSFHNITLVTGSAFIANSFSDNSNDVLIVPAYGLNYDYQINGKWGVGIHTDILLQQFKIEKHGTEEEVVRENPVAISAILSYKLHNRWKIIGGYGVEMEQMKIFNSSELVLNMVLNFLRIGSWALLSRMILKLMGTIRCCWV